MHPETTVAKGTNAKISIFRCIIRNVTSNAQLQTVTAVLGAYPNLCQNKCEFLRTKLLMKGVSKTVYIL